MNEVRDELILANLGLVYNVAKRCAVNRGDMDDLVGEGWIGLIHAAELYEPESGHKFSTYAVPAIRNQIVNYLNERSGLIRLPRYAVAMFRGKASKRRAGKAATRNAPIIRERAEAVMRPMERDEGFGLSITTEEPGVLDQLIEDEKMLPLRQIGNALGCLDARERAIIERRYLTEPRLTLDQTGRLLEKPITREWVRRLEAKALAKMREFLMGTGIT